MSRLRIVRGAVLVSLACLAGPAAAEVLPPGCPLARRAFSNTTPVPIPADSAAVVTSTIDVTGLRGRVFDLTVRTELTHASSADLDITLTSPSGRVVTLTTDNGGPGPDAFGGTTWSDRANPGGQAPYSSNDGLVTDQVYKPGFAVPLLAPEEALGAFAGEDPGGTWTLTISDDTAGNGGQLSAWSLDIRTRPAWVVESTGLLPGPAPLAIPSGPATVSATLVVPPGAGRRFLSRVQVHSGIVHQRPLDLDVTLRSPQGTVVTLTTDNGSGSNADSFNQRVWRDDANPGGQLPYSLNAGLTTDWNYPSGSNLEALAPEEPLAAFVGEDPEGPWVLTISDDLSGMQGTLNNWGLTLETVVECSSKGDFDRSRSDDLVLRHEVTNQHLLWFMDGLARVSSAPLIPNPAASLRVVGSDEFLGSAARPDLVLQDAGTGQVEFWNMNGASLVGSPVPLTGAAPPPLNWRLSAVGDFNHDGSADLLWRNTTSQKLVIWTLGEDGAPTTHKTGVIAPNPDQAAHANWEIVAALDFDGDNNRDLLWYNATSGKIVIWFMDEQVRRLTGTFTDPPSAGDANWRVVAAGDYGPPASGDQVPDIVWRNATSGKLVVWHLNGDREHPARIAGGFTLPDAPEDPLRFTVVAPR